MKNHKEILESFEKDEYYYSGTIKEYSEYTIKEAMNLAAKQAFEAGQEYTSVNPTTITQGFEFDHETFEDYLKELEND